MKQRQLEKRGMPDLKNGRFVTLTIDRGNDLEGYLSEAEAYELGKEKLRRFVFEIRKTYKVRRWFWKMELHKPDAHGRQFPHWHFWFDYGGTIPGAKLTKAWGLGRTDIRKVRSDEWKYLFKYMCKASTDLPEWLSSRRQIRLFQTSMGFFAGSDKQEQQDTPSPRQIAEGNETQNEGSQLMDTIGERVHRWTQCVVSRSISKGRVIHRLVRMEGKRWGDLLNYFAQIRERNGLCPDDIEITERKIRSWLPINPTILPAHS